MGDAYGNKIIEAIQTIASHGIDVKTKEIGKAKTYYFGDARYKVEIIINPPKWIGLEFVLLGSKLWYPINTDLYDISKSKNAAFAISIESGIANFLRNFYEGHIKIAHTKHGPMLLIPEGTKYALLKQGRFMASKSTFDSVEDVKSKGEFSRFPFKV